MTKDELWDFIVRTDALGVFEDEDISATREGGIWVRYIDPEQSEGYFETSPYEALCNINDDVCEYDADVPERDIWWLHQQCATVIRDRYRLYLQNQLEYIEGIV
jgi:hypothetical protein